MNLWGPRLACATPLRDSRRLEDLVGSVRPSTPNRRGSPSSLRTQGSWMYGRFQGTRCQGLSRWNQEFELHGQVALGAWRRGCGRGQNRPASRIPQFAL